MAAVVVQLYFRVGFGDVTFSAYPISSS